MPIILALVFFFTLFRPVFATDSPATVSVTPSLLQIDLRTQSPDTLLYYKNLSRYPLDLALSVKDFSSLEEAGKVNFLDEKDAKNYQYSLSSWISFETTHLSLAPGEQKTIRVHIEKEKLPVGGHYAAILAEFVQRDVTGTIPLRGVLSSLVFVRAGKGFEREEARLAGVGQDGSFPYFPLTVFFRFQNTGNIDLTPYGLVTITDFLGRTVAKGIVNEGSFIALPESIRRFDVHLEPSVRVLLPGMYHVHLALHFGETNKKLTSDFSFFSQGTIDFVKIIGLLILLGLVFLGYRTWKKPFKKA